MVSRILKRASESVEKRADDNEATIKNRIETFIRNTDEILSQYPNQTKRVRFVKLRALFARFWCVEIKMSPFFAGGWWTRCWHYICWSITGHFRSYCQKVNLMSIVQSPNLYFSKHFIILEIIYFKFIVVYLNVERFFSCVNSNLANQFDMTILNWTKFTCPSVLHERYY